MRHNENRPPTRNPRPNPLIRPTVTDDDEPKPNWPLAIAKVGVETLAYLALAVAALGGLAGAGMGIAACQEGKVDNCVGGVGLWLLALLPLTAGATAALITAKRSYETFVVWTAGLASLAAGTALTIAITTAA